MGKYSDYGRDDKLGKEFDIIDIKRLEELSKMAFYHICMDEGCTVPEEEVGKTIPDNSYTAFELKVWDLMRKTVRYGMALEKFLIC